jgi:hypothetical protein
MNKRQERAEAITRELRRLGVATLNALPLSDDQNLRFQVLNTEREAILAKLGEWGWSVALKSQGPRFMLDGTTPMASVYEIDIPHDRPAVPTDRVNILHEAPSERISSPAEVEAVKKHLGLDVK